MKRFIQIKPIDIKEITSFYSVMILLMAYLIFSYKLVFNTYAAFMLENTYIEVIDTPSYGNSTKEFLEEFNSMGDNKIISFVKPKRFGRPVRIREMTDFMEELQPEVLGSAYRQFDECLILVRKGAELVEYRETILHEYLHCMGYDHSIKRYDLMYKYSTYVDKEDNIRYYANDLRKKYYE